MASCAWLRRAADRDQHRRRSRCIDTAHPPLGSGYREEIPAEVTSRDRRADGTPEHRPTRRGVAAGTVPKGIPTLRLGGRRAAQVQEARRWRLRPVTFLPDSRPDRAAEQRGLPASRFGRSRPDAKPSGGIAARQTVESKKIQIIWVRAVLLLRHLTCGRVPTRSRTIMPLARGAPRRDATHLKDTGIWPPKTKTVAFPRR